MSASLLIFDFDGVIADSFNCFYPMIRDGMASVGISISKKEYKNLFLGNVHEGFKKFIKNDKKKYEMFSNYRKTHISDYYKSSIFPDAINFLKTVKKNGYKTAICSSGQKEIVLKTLNINKIKNCFDMILATGEYTKENMIKVTKTFLPPIDIYQENLKEIWQTGWITNHGPNSKKLEAELADYFKVQNIR